MGKKVEYTNGELTIVWQPEMCQHAGICVKCYPMFTTRKRGRGYKSRMLQRKS